MKKWMLGSAFIAVVLLSVFCFQRIPKVHSSKEVVEKTWKGYKYYFIDPDGRVKRTEQNDTVSEGQAYAMLRAVWMGDKPAYDACYAWSEKHLCRTRVKGDCLLAWRWKDGRVMDWMPASDADIDYSLSLIFADARWGAKSPAGLPGYSEKARQMLADILRLETFTLPGGRLYLSPWILSGEPKGLYPQNPSYYSPAHFKIFYQFTKDKRWLELADTSYQVISSASTELDGSKGDGLVPDWARMDLRGRFFSWKEKGSDFSWDAVRSIFRVALDEAWFKDERARIFLQGDLRKFLEKKWIEKGFLVAGYRYHGEALNRYESPFFYSAYGTLFKVACRDKFADDALEKTRHYLRKEGDRWVYQDHKSYYLNSLSWMSEGFEASVIKNLSKDKGGK